MTSCDRTESQKENVFLTFRKRQFVQVVKIFSEQIKKLALFVSQRKLLITKVVIAKCPTDYASALNSGKSLGTNTCTLN